MRKFILSIALALALSLFALLAQDFDAGWNAYEDGDYATTLKEWKPLAERGHAVARHALGLMYRRGQGVLQDYQEAVRWY